MQRAGIIRQHQIGLLQQGGKLLDRGLPRQAAYVTARQDLKADRAL